MAPQRAEVSSLIGSLRESFGWSGSRTLLLEPVKTYVTKVTQKIRFRVASRSGFGRGKSMTRSEVLLAILAASEGRPFTPVQIQKAAFLVTTNLPRLVNAGPNFGFVPYDYGPFDQSVYSEAETLAAQRDVEITRREGVRWNQYAASDKGIERGTKILDKMSESQRDYVKKISQWVRALSFEQLVKAIYAQYPDMKENSIFRG
jgi:hypothetical protein